MSIPAPPEHGITFNLETVGREPRAEESYSREGRTARALIGTSDLRIVVVAVGAGNGKTISEQQANLTAAMQTLCAHIRTQLPDREVDLAEGQLLAAADVMAVREAAR